MRPWLAIVIGRRFKNVTVDDALQYVAGYSVSNDVSARDLQQRTHQWTAGKILDSFGPMGPGITPRDEVVDVQKLAHRGQGERPDRPGQQHLQDLAGG